MTGVLQSALRAVKPLVLREKLYYHLVVRFGLASHSESQSAELVFAPRCRLALSPTDVGHQVILWTGFYELGVSRPIARLAQNGGLLVDVGANYGYYSTIWASASRDNRVVAFEVDADNLEALRQNLARNKLQDRVTIRDTAVGRTNGLAFFREGTPGQTGQGNVFEHESDQTKAVPMVTLDAEFRARTIDVLKIDVEGADTWVLEGSRELLQRKAISHIFFEQLPERMVELGVNPDAASQLLETNGYAVTRLATGEYYAAPRGQ